MKLLVIAASTAVLLTLAGCGSFAKKPTVEAVKNGRQVNIEMRFDASDMIERASEAGCDVEAIQVEASRRKDTITLTCREPKVLGKTSGSKTVITIP